MFQSFFHLISNIKNGVQNAFFQLYIFQWRIFFFPTIKILTPHNYTTSKTGCNFFSGSTNCYVTGVFHIASKFLVKVVAITSHFVHPSVGMQADAKCMIWQKCGGVRKHSTFFLLHTKTGDSDRIWNSIHSCYVRVSPLCVFVPTNPCKPTVSSGPAGVPNLTCPFSLFLLQYMLCFFLAFFFFCTTLSLHPSHF